MLKKRIFPVIPSLTLFWVAFLTASILAQPLLPAPVPRPAPREPGQKSIEEVWHELEMSTFKKPTFDELGTLHEGYSFEELWEIARTNNPSIRLKSNMIAAASGGRLQAGLYPNPTLTYGGDNLGVDGEAGKHGLAISQEIVTAKKKKLDRAVASYDVSAARKEYSMECLKLQNDLKIAHYELICALLVYKVEQFSQRISTGLLDAALTLQKQGKVKTVDVLQFRTMLNSSQLTLKQAENNQRAAWQRLVSVLGTPELPYQPVRGTVVDRTPPRDWQGTWLQFQQASPQLALSRLKVEQARVYLARQEAERISNVSATFALSQDIPADNTVPFVGISVPLKIYDKNQGNIAKAKAEVAVAAREAERVTLSLHKRLADVFRDYENAKELIEVYETSIIPDSFEALRQIGEIYRAGSVTYLELYHQRQAVVTALLQYINALKMRAVAATQIDGMLLEGTLDF
ncbi:divalent cation transporter [Planctomycetales bacterium]|nr:divalent cation transporter [Planctomycetales bacterium]